MGECWRGEKKVERKRKGGERGTQINFSIQIYDISSTLSSPTFSVVSISALGQLSVPKFSKNTISQIGVCTVLLCYIAVIY